ncbi:MAG: hypothetical protein COA78_18755 [Blastopirellula sp.]|nr:MAG: hypothetical protein COA78_18755 [Blastopirellula sp.]
MNYSKTCMVLLLFASLAACLTVATAEPRQANRTPASRQLEMARLRLRIYERQEYPLKRRKLSSEIEMTKAELKSLERRQKEYSQFTRFKYSAPLFDEIERVHLAELGTKLRLNDLIAEKSLLERYHADRLKLMRLELEAAEEILLVR